MNSLPEKECRNCSASIPEDARYCPVCSQKYSTGKVPVKTFIQDFFSHYFDLDSRFFRTLFALAVPGKLTVEYFKGKHKSYSSPLQLFLVPAFFLFALVSFNIANSDLGDNAILSLKEDIDWIDFYAKLDTAKQQTDSSFNNAIAYAATDTLQRMLKAHYPNIDDSLDIGNFGVFNSDLNVPIISKKDLLLKTPDELAELYGKDKSFTGKMILRQATKFRQGGRGIIEYFISKLSITLLLMMPFLALILMILYIRHDYYYVEHLVFTLHFHAFAFLLILALGLLGDYLPEAVLVIAILSMFVYLYLALLKVYGQGWFKTFLKFWGVFWSYMFIAVFFSILAMVFSFLLF